LRIWNGEPRRMRSEIHQEATYKNHPVRMEGAEICIGKVRRMRDGQ